MVSVVSFEAADSADDVVGKSEVSSTCFTESDYDYCLPVRASIAGPVRIHSTSRRNVNVQRQNFEFVKSGRIINPGIRCLIQKTSINNNTSLTDPASRLLSLCKLII